jgi:very-short-patch-repair endonuclease
MRSQYETQLERLIHLAGLPEPVLQFAFAKEYGRLYRWDFAWTEFKLAVEVDGGRFMGRGGSARTMSRTAPLGYHGSVEDNRKRNLANLLGWTILVYSPEMIRSGEAVAELKLALEQKAGRPWQERLSAHAHDVFNRESLKRRVANLRKKGRRPRPVE